MGFLKQYLADNAHREVDAAQVASAMAASTHTVVDVREQDEWNEGHIAAAVHIPLGELAGRVNELPDDKPIYTVCRSGVRSITAIDILDANGHTGARSMAGGMIAWAAVNEPIVR